MLNEDNNEFRENDECKSSVSEIDDNKSSGDDIVHDNIFDNKPQINNVNPKIYLAPKKNGLIKTISIGLVCIFGCGAIGVGIGVGSSLTDKYLNRNSVNNSNKFSFQNSQPQTILSTPNINNQEPVSMINNVSKSIVSIDTVVNSDTGIFFGLPSQQRGAGSGIIFHEDNDKIYIVTNCHVIDGASAVNVSIEKSLGIPAKLVGKDFQADLAVIYIEKKDVHAQGITNISVAKFGDSDKIQVGESIIAIGNALGEGITVTSGIVSAKDKKITIDNRELNVIQIDASVNNGNSGGALVNSYGEVVGITTVKVAKFTVEGMAYCLPSNNVKPVIEDILNEPNRPFLGIKGTNITQEISANYGLPTMGVLVNLVIENSNAQKYGVEAGDIITMVDGKSIYTIEELSSVIKHHHINDKIKLHVMRIQNGKINGIDLDITLESFINSNF